MVYQDKAAKVHAESIVIDGLNISNWQESETFSHLNQGGVTAINATVAVWENFPETLDNIARWYPRFEEYSDIIMPARTAADIERAKAEGKCGIIFGFQNSSPIEDDLRRLRIFYELGVRVIQVTYNRSNFVGSGYTDSPDYGLSNFGLDFVEECNRLGILLDCSHAGHKTTMDTIEVSQKPIAFTHAAPRVLWNIQRNKTDEELKALGDQGRSGGCLRLCVLSGAEGEGYPLRFCRHYRLFGQASRHRTCGHWYGLYPRAEPAMATMDGTRPQHR